MRLYDHPASGNCLKCRILLRGLGLEYETVEVDLFRGETRTPEHFARNPDGRVPVLELDDGATIPESGAILLHLAEGTPLLPADPLARARVRAVCALIGCDIHPLNNVGVLRYIKRVFGQEQAAIDEWYRHWIVEGFQALEHLIEPGPFAFGPRPTLADVYLAPQVYNAVRLKVPMGPYPKIAAADAACARLEAFKAAAPEAQADAV